MTKNEFKRKYWYPISVSIELRLRKVRRFVDRLYLKVWPFIFGFWVLVVLTWGTLMFLHDYNLLHNCANLDAPFSDYYTKWSTYGTPGQDPPIK
jgi:hypothetical protein